MGMKASIRDGVHNLLVNCIGATAGESLLLVAECPSYGYFCGELRKVVAAEAIELGLVATIHEAPVLAAPDDLPPCIKDKVGDFDHVIFLARIGDQLRFKSLDRSRNTQTMVYTLDARFLQAPMASLNHKGMLELKTWIEAQFTGQKNWQVTCPLGTSLSGMVDYQPASSNEVQVKRFPLMTYQPVMASAISGRIALARWLVGTCSRLYEPYVCMLDTPVFAEVENGRIAGFTGETTVVGKVEEHYHTVGKMFDIDPWIVHSFHTGMNPQTFYPGDATEDIARWASVIFGSTRFLHFHTCGDYAPGEISISTIDPTMIVDGQTYWPHGDCCFSGDPAVQAIFAKYPDLGEAFANPRRDIGVEPIAA
jgi:hypothetical protein